MAATLHAFAQGARYLHTQSGMYKKACELGQLNSQPDAFHDDSEQSSNSIVCYAPDVTPGGLKWHNIERTDLLQSQSYQLGISGNLKSSLQICLHPAS